VFGPLGGSGAGLGQAPLLPSTTCAAGSSGACARTQRAACGGAQAAAFVQLGLGEEEGLLLEFLSYAAQCVKAPAAPGPAPARPALVESG
jgi:hypothetical protein